MGLAILVVCGGCLLLTSVVVSVYGGDFGLWFVVLLLVYDVYCSYLRIVVIGACFSLVISVLLCLVNSVDVIHFYLCL